MLTTETAVFSLPAVMVIPAEASPGVTIAADKME